MLYLRLKETLFLLFLYCLSYLKLVTYLPPVLKVALVLLSLVGVHLAPRSLVVLVVVQFLVRAPTRRCLVLVLLNLAVARPLHLIHLTPVVRLSAQALYLVVPAVSLRAPLIVVLLYARYRVTWNVNHTAQEVLIRHHQVRALQAAQKALNPAQVVRLAA